jgi:hypothetical protein
MWSWVSNAKLGHSGVESRAVQAESRGGACRPTDHPVRLVQRVEDTFTLQEFTRRCTSLIGCCFRRLIFAVSIVFRFVISSLEPCGSH